MTERVIRVNDRITGVGCGRAGGCDYERLVKQLEGSLGN